MGRVAMNVRDVAVFQGLGALGQCLELDARHGRKSSQSVPRLVHAAVPADIARRVVPVDLPASTRS